MTGRLLISYGFEILCFFLFMYVGMTFFLKKKLGNDISIVDLGFLEDFLYYLNYIRQDFLKLLFLCTQHCFTALRSPLK